MAIELSNMSKNDEELPQSSNEHTQSKNKARAKENIQFLMLFWALFSAGYNDGSTGPLLPRIQHVYNVCRNPNPDMLPMMFTLAPRSVL